jgi:hypothetical protein
MLFLVLALFGTFRAWDVRGLAPVLQALIRGEWKDMSDW